MAMFKKQPSKDNYPTHYHQTGKTTSPSTVDLTSLLQPNLETYKVTQLNQQLAPVLYLPHGGGPLPLLADKKHQRLVTFLKGVSKTFQQPAAILVISAHWEATTASITSSYQPNLVYDYYGFPPSAYTISYPALGHPELAKHIVGLVENAGITINLAPQQGFDHGVFVPLKIMYPQAQIPCLQLSLLNSFDPAAHIALGKSIAALRKENILIVGSGMSFIISASSLIIQQKISAKVVISISG
jgi:aromatic ring-opening dioxygenase catalytic subunit (LigB family)